MGRCAGLVVGWSSTDGVYIDGELVEAGDYSGPSGAARVLDDPRVRLAVTETARGGILLRGLGVVHNDVSVDGIGFGASENEITIIGAAGEETLPRMSKEACAGRILDAVAPLLR